MMHFLLICLSASLATATFGGSNTYMLRWDSLPGYQGIASSVSFANSSMWAGDMKRMTYAEAFVFNSNPDKNKDGGISITSIHSSPTGWQDACIVEGDTQPIKFTRPHSASVPDGATMIGWRFLEDETMTFKGENKFVACQNDEQKELNSWQIWWQGGERPEGLECASITLKRGPVYAY